MINIIKLDFTPSYSEWTHSSGDAISILAMWVEWLFEILLFARFLSRADKDSNQICLYDGKGESVPLQVYDSLHTAPVVAIKLNVPFETVISIDKKGILEYWTISKHDYTHQFPTKKVHFESKLDTALYDFAKNKTIVTGLDVSADGKRFATISTDRKVRIFNFLTGKLFRVFDEALARFQELQQTPNALPNMEFGRRMATERDLEKSEYFNNANIIFDATGHFVLYSTMIGIKLINIETNRCIVILGKTDNIRPLHIGLFQGKGRKSKAAITIEQEASDNPALQLTLNDPTVFATAYK